MSKTIININENKMNLQTKLSKIQVEFKANKSRFNSFGKYNFRSAEDILEGLKPLNEKYGVMFTIKETLINANPPVMMSIATISDIESQDSIEGTSIVGVDLDQKGMQMPQRYGSASSYAKKYALGNLLLIDDTQDADATNKHGNEPKSKPELLLDSDEFKKVKDYLTGGGDISLVDKKYILSNEIKKALNEN